MEGEGVQAVAGALYVYAYDTDILTVTAHPEDRTLAVLDCAGVESGLPYYAAGTARFRAGASGPGRGWNPCIDQPPVSPPPPPPVLSQLAKVWLHIGGVVGAGRGVRPYPLDRWMW